MTEDYEPTALDDLYDSAFAKMTEILGVWEPGTTLGHLHDAADKALVVFRDLLDAAVLSQAGADTGERLDHANHEIALMLAALHRARPD